MPPSFMDIKENSLNILQAIFGPFLKKPQSKSYEYSCLMPRVFLDSYVQGRPKSWRNFVQIIFFQTL